MSELQCELCSDPLLLMGDSSSSSSFSPDERREKMSLFLSWPIRDLRVSWLGAVKYTERIMARQVALSSFAAQSSAGGLPCNKT